MTNTLTGTDFQTELQRIEALLGEVERFPDPAAQTHMRALVRAVLDLHGAGLERILTHLDAAGDAGRTVLDTCASDHVVCGLLLLHGLHPLTVEERVREALDDVRPYLNSHGGNVELVGVSEGIVRLRLDGSCHSCPSSAVTMQQTIEEAILGKAPEVTAVEVEGLVEAVPEKTNGEARVALPLV